MEVVHGGLAPSQSESDPRDLEDVRPTLSVHFQHVTCKQQTVSGPWRRGGGQATHE